MKSFLVTAVITTFVLALFFHSGNAIVCYECPLNNCDNQVTCKSPQDTCLTILYGARNESRCWKYSDCNTDALSQQLGIKNFRYECCQRNLCNNAPNVVTSKIVLSGSLLLIVVHMLKSLV